MKMTSSFCTFAVSVAMVLISCNSSNNNIENNSLKDSSVTAVDTTYKAPNKIPALFIDDGGSGGTPILFVHSFGGSSKHWAAQLAHFRKTNRAIAFDLRGHGQSPAPADSNYNIDGFAADIARVADSLQLQKFILVGHSLGGAAAIAYAGIYPSRIEGLVLEGTPGKTPPEQVEKIMSSLNSSQYDTVMANYMKGLLKNATPFTDSIERTGMTALSKPVILKIIKAVFDFDPVQPLSSYAGPTLIISTTSENQPGSLQSFFPKLKHEVVPNTSHWIHMDNPEKFNALLDAFVEKLKQ